MKQKKAFILLSLLIIIFTLFSSCASYSPQSSSPQANTPSSPSADSGSDAKIKQLETQIAILTQSQAANEDEYHAKLEYLQKELEELKKQNTATAPDNSGESNDSQNQSAPNFIYEIENNCAVITGYTGDDETLVIPTSIDGYKVAAIADSAISSKTIKEVIVSSSVTKIGWFAFSNCPKLKSVTIPSSVTKIGYSAFGATDSSIIIYCQSGSFAQSYAESYGLSYTLL